MRGSHTHGGGSKKKRRGAGHRGGRGKAGSGKRGDAKKPRFWKDTKYFGKAPFVSVNKKQVNAINLSDVDTKLSKWVDKELAVKKGDVFSVDLNKLGYQKLLGTGNISKKINITVNSSTEKALDKVKKAGGEVILPSE